MARPLRRVVIELALRIGLDYRVVEQWDMEAIREHIAILSDSSKPKARVQTPEELHRGLMAAFGNPKEK
jgi:hypothetical protein